MSRKIKPSSTPILSSNSHLFQNAPCALVGPASTGPLHVATPVAIYARQPRHPCGSLDVTSRLASNSSAGELLLPRKDSVLLGSVLLATATPFLPKFPALCCTSTSIPKAQTTTLNGPRFVRRLTFLIQIDPTVIGLVLCVCVSVCTSPSISI